MKNIVLLLYVSLVMAMGLQANIWNQEPKSFKEGEVYQFNYTSQVLSGLPKTSAEFHGLQINSLVEFKFEASSMVQMTLKSVEFLETKTIVKTRNPYGFVDTKNLKKFMETNSEKFSKLFLPVRFKWKYYKKITNFKTSNDDAFSVNIKRGILNMLNLKLKLNKDNWNDDGGSYMIPDDESIEGICEANYVWSSYPYRTPTKKNDGARSISITRTKSANNCRKPNGRSMANFLIYKNPQKEVDSNQTLVKNFNEASLNLTVWESKKFFLWEGWSKSSYSIEPKNTEKETISTFVVQSIKFLQVNKVSKTDTKSTTVSKSLLMDLSPVEIILSEEDKTKIISIIEGLGELKGNVIPELLRLLRLANHKDIKEINKKVLKMVKTKPDLLRPYLDVLSEVHTFPTAKLFIHDFVLKPMPHINDDNEMAMRISSMSGMSYVGDTEIIDLLTKAVASPVLLKHKNRPNTLKTILMTIGSLSGSHYSVRPSYDIFATVQYFTKIVPKLKSNMGKEELFIVILKALGNMGVSQTYPYLKKYIINKKESIALRVQAIYSLRKLRRQNSTIDDLLLRVFDDVKEDVELRLAAGVDICLRYSRKSSLSVLVNRLEREPILQVKSFMQDLLIQLSKMSKLKDTFQPLLRRLTIKNYANEYSRVFTMPFENRIVLMSMIYSPDSRIPRTGNIIFMDFEFGKMIIPYEFGFRFQNKKGFKFTQQNNFLNILLNIPMPESQQSLDSGFVTVFVKKFDNEIGFWSMDNEIVKMFDENKAENFIKFIKGEKSLTFNRYRNMIINGEIIIPTTMGLPYSAQVNSIIDARLDLELLKVFQPKKKMSHLKIDIKPFFKLETSLNVGIDAGLLKSTVRARFRVITPDPVWFTYLRSDNSLSRSIGMKKPTKDINLFALVLEKKFKVIYYKKINDLWGSEKLIDINPFYSTKDNLKNQTATTIPFPLGMKLVYIRSTDAGKQLNDGTKMSWFSAGDAYASMSLTKSKSSEIDEFQLSMKEDIVHGRRNYVLSANHFKKQKVRLEIDLISLDVNFGVGNSITLKWPENLKEIISALDITSSDSKKPKLKYVKFTGSVQYPRPLQFDSSNPLKIWTHLEKYSYRFKGMTKKISVDITLSMDEQAKNLGLNIAKNPSLYSADDDILSQCSRDIQIQFPNSPACISSWSKLNYYNQISISAKWNEDALGQMKNLYNKLNNRQYISNYLISEQFVKSEGHYKIQYSLLPYFYPSAIAATTIFSLERMYKSADLTRLHMMQNLFKSISAIPMFNNTEYGMCQLRLSRGNAMSIKSFDNYFYNFEKSQIGTKTKSIKIIFVQEVTNQFQVSAIQTAKERIIQVIGNSIPVLRLTKERYKNKVEFNIKTAHKLNHYNMRKLDYTIYGNTTMYEIEVPLLQLIVLTDMDYVLDIKVSKNYKSEVRGLCGDMNGEIFNDFKNADCTGIFEKPERMLGNSVYIKNFVGTPSDRDLNSYLSLKKCQRGAQLSLL